MSTRRKKVKAAKESWTDLAGVRDAQWVLPRTAEAYDQMVEQMAKALDICLEHGRRAAKAALRSLGITRPKTKASQ